VGFLSNIRTAYRSLLGMHAVPAPINKSFSPELVNQIQTDLQKAKASREPKAFFLDPDQIHNAMGYKDKPFSLSYDILRRMATQDAVIAAIINTRVNQVSAFSRPARFDYSGVGYEIKLRDPNETPSEEDKKMIVALEEFLENTGFDRDTSRDSFDTFLRKIVRDRLIYDQVCFEIVPDRKGRPAAFYAVDASTIRVASEQLMESVEGEIDEDEEIKYVQIIDGQIVAQFTANELAFCTANPRSDIDVSPYGFSELEQLIKIVTSRLWAEEYNTKFFSQGGTTKGIINLKPGTSKDGDDLSSYTIPQEQIEAFRRQWLAQVSGVSNSWKTPVVSVPDLQYVEVGKSNSEMEYEKWMNYLVNVACAVYQIDPAEINFPNRGGISNSSGGLGEGGIKDRIKNSRDKGLRPLLRFIEDCINRHIIYKFDPRFVFAFVGIDSKSEAEIADLNRKHVETYMTVNEIRRREDLDPLPPEQGDVILNSVWLQYVNSQKQLELQQKQMEIMNQQGFGGFEEEGGNDEDTDYQEQDNETSDKSEVEAKDIMEDNSEDAAESHQVSENVNKSLKFLTIELED